jgi:heavy metal-binding protein
MHFIGAISRPELARERTNMSTEGFLIPNGTDPAAAPETSPPELTRWQKFRLVVKVVELRLRFIALMAATGLVFAYWDTLWNYYDKWTRPDGEHVAAASDIEYYCPMHPNIMSTFPATCPYCGMALQLKSNGVGRKEHPGAARLAGLTNPLSTDEPSGRGETRPIRRTAFWSAQQGNAPVHEGHEHKHGAPLHGGKVAMTKEYHFEVVFAKDGLKVFPRTQEDKPIDAPRLTGTATFYHPSSPKPWFERKLAPSAPSPSHATTSIGLRIDLSKVPASGAKVAFRVEGMPDPGEPTATFTVPFILGDDRSITVAKVTKADEKAIAALKTCPVSSEDLGGEMGAPIKIARGGRSIFLCCKNCLKQVQANPDKFFSAPATPHSEAGHHDH